MADRNTKNVTFSLGLKGWRSVAAGADQTGKSFVGLGKDAELAGRRASGSAGGWGLFEKRAGTARKETDRLHLSMRGLAETGAGLGAGFFAFEGLKSSVDTVDRLGEATLNLHRTQGLTTKSAGQLAAVADVNDISQGSLATSLGVLSRNVINATKQQKIHAVTMKYSTGVTKQLAAAQDVYENKLMGLGATARDNIKRQQYLDTYNAKRQKIIQAGRRKSALDAAHGIGTQAEAFKALGISQKVLKRGNVGQIFTLLDKRLTKMPGSAKKNSLALAIFGRGYKQILPLFKDGQVSFQQQIKWADKYGVALSGRQKDFEKFKAGQLQAKYASEGFQVQVGTQLIPALTNFLPVAATFVHGLTGIAHWLGKNKTIARDAGLGLIGLGLAMPIAKAARLAGWLAKGVGAARGLGKVKLGTTIANDIGGSGKGGLSGLRGSTPETPLYVAVVNGGLPGGGGTPGTPPIVPGGTRSPLGRTRIPGGIIGGAALGALGAFADQGDQPYQSNAQLNNFLKANGDTSDRFVNGKFIRGARASAAAQRRAAAAGLTAGGGISYLTIPHLGGGPSGSREMREVSALGALSGTSPVTDTHVVRLLQAINAGIRAGHVVKISQQEIVNATVDGTLVGDLLQ